MKKNHTLLYAAAFLLTAALFYFLGNQCTPKAETSSSLSIPAGAIYGIITDLDETEIRIGKPKLSTGKLQEDYYFDADADTKFLKGNTEVSPADFSVGDLVAVSSYDSIQETYPAKICAVKQVRLLDPAFASP